MNIWSLEDGNLKWSLSTSRKGFAMNFFSTSYKEIFQVENMKDKWLRFTKIILPISLLKAFSASNFTKHC